MDRIKRHLYSSKLRQERYVRRKRAKNIIKNSENSKDNFNGNENIGLDNQNLPRISEQVKGVLDCDVEDNNTSHLSADNENRTYPDTILENISNIEHLQDSEEMANIQPFDSTGYVQHTIPISGCNTSNGISVYIETPETDHRKVNSSDDELLEDPMIKNLKQYIKSQFSLTTSLITEVKSELKAVNSEISLLRIENQELKTLVSESCALKSQDDVISFTDLVRKYQLKLPFKDLKDYLEFEELLVANEALSSDLKRHFISTTNSNVTILDGVKHAIKKFFTGHVLSFYVAQKQLSGSKKSIFKSTRFCTILQDSILHCFGAEKGCQKNYFTALSLTFTLAKDWDGARNERLLKYIGRKINSSTENSGNGSEP